MIKAIPTEYSGVVFRSKCEAVFARLLDLSGRTWEYEPDGLGGRMDFYYPVYSSRKITHCFIEYKPSRPTKSYITNKFSMIADDVGILLDQGLRVTCFIVAGNAFDSNDVEVWFLRNVDGDWEDFGKKRVDFAFPKHLFIEAAMHRFDLEHAL